MYARLAKVDGLLFWLLPSHRAEDLDPTVFKF